MFLAVTHSFEPLRLFIIFFVNYTFKISPTFSLSILLGFFPGFQLQALPAGCRHDFEDVWYQLPHFVQQTTCPHCRPSGGKAFALKKSLSRSRFRKMDNRAVFALVGSLLWTGVPMSLSVRALALIKLLGAKNCAPEFPRSSRAMLGFAAAFCSRCLGPGAGLF